MIEALLLTLLIIFWVVIMYIRRLLKGPVCNIRSNLKKQVVIITGANTGIGKETAKEIAFRGATVILACRNEIKGEKVCKSLIKITKNENIEFRKLDLSSIESIKSFAESFKKAYAWLNILINNAATGINYKKAVSKDGNELVMGTNYIGHFFLTNLLLDYLEKTPQSRIINISCQAYARGNIDYEDILGSKQEYSECSYHNSKLAIVLWTKELNRRLSNSNVKTCVVNPGIVITHIWRNVYQSWKLCIPYIFVYPFIWMVAKSAWHGAQTILYCSLVEWDKLEGGKFYRHCKVLQTKSIANDPIQAAKLWDETCKIINIK